MGEGERNLKIKAVHVLDAATDVYYLVGKPEIEDFAPMQWIGWGMRFTKEELPKVTSPTLIVKPRANTTYCAMSHFDVPEIDLEERGNIEVDHTSLALARAVRNIPFEMIPDEYDFTQVVLS